MKRRSYKGKNNPNYGNHKLKGEKNPSYKDGRCLKQYYCKICNRKITIFSGLYGKGKCNSCAKKEAYQGINNPMYGKIRLDMRGKNNPNYRHGKGYDKYPYEFTKMRIKIKNRDNYKCQNCNITEEEHIILHSCELSVHHIDYNMQNNKENNLITLCNQCNQRANFNRKYWKNLYSQKVLKIREVI